MFRVLLFKCNCTYVVIVLIYTHKFMRRFTNPVHKSVTDNFFIVSWGGVRLSRLRTSATIWPIVPAPDDR
jgi:hypothetical protein